MAAVSGAPPRVAVIIPARNEQATIGQCLSSLACQRYAGPLEIIIVDDGSDDRTREIVKERPEVKLLAAGGRGPSYARNLGMASTDAPVVAFTDADCICHPAWVQELVDTLIGGRFTGAGGAQRSPEQESRFGRQVQEFLEAVGFVANYVTQAHQVIPTEHNPTCNVAYRREAVLAVGGFDEAMWPGEDCDLDHRLSLAGHELAFNPRAVVYHFRPRDMAGFRRMMRNYGRAQAFLVRKHGPFRPLHAVPLVVTAGISVAPLLAGPLLPLWAMLGGVVPLVHFARRSGSARRAIRHTRFLYETLAWWNLGFAEELMFKKM